MRARRIGPKKGAIVPVICPCGRTALCDINGVMGMYCALCGKGYSIDWDAVGDHATDWLSGYRRDLTPQ